jgi:SHO1 osmosensor
MMFTLTPRPDTASADDPNEISFVKGEILDIVDNRSNWWQANWWQAKKSDGTVGSA